MRSSLLLLFACGCELIDISQPIAIIASGLSDEDAAALEEGARCWNLAYGTQFVFDNAHQQVEAFYDEQTCLIGAAQVQAGWPLRIGVCPPRYWNGIRADIETNVRTTSFRVFSHELGHVLNINGHPASDPYATMRSGNNLGAAMFSDADTEILAESNPDFVFGEPACRRIVRTLRIGSQGNVGRCGCETSETLDLARPIAIVLDPQFSDAQAAMYRNAAECWNLRYGLSIEVRPPNPGDQVAHVEPSGTECLSSVSNLARSRDGDSVAVCGSPSEQPRIDEAMRTIGMIFGVRYGLFVSSMPFPPSIDDAFEAIYPGQPIACRDVRASSASVCSCVVP